MRNPLTTKLGIAALAGVVGIGLGSASADSTKPVSNTEPIERVVTKIEEVEVEVTPQSCKDAIQYAREGFTVASDFGTIMSNFLEAASVMDLRGMERQTAKMPSVTSRLSVIGPKFNSASSDCEAS